MELVISLLGERLAAVLPGWLRRRLYPDARLLNDVRLRLRGNNPIVFELNSSPPAVRVWWEVENHSPVDVVLDRITLAVWAQAPIAYGVYADRKLVGRHSTQGEILFTAILTAEGVEAVRRTAASPGWSASVAATPYFQSPWGPFELPFANYERRFELPA